MTSQLLLNALPFGFIVLFWLVHLFVAAWRSVYGRGWARWLSAGALVAGLGVLTFLLPREIDWIYTLSFLCFALMIPLQFASSLGPGHTRRWPDWLYLAAFAILFLPSLIMPW